MIGRPKKYDGEMIALNLSIPRLYKNTLEEEAYGCRVSVNEYMNGLIASADKELAKELISSMKEMRQELASKTEILNETSRELTAFKGSSSNALNYLTSMIEDDPKLDEMIKSAISRHERLFLGLLKNTGAKEAIDEVVDKVYTEIEMILLQKGRAIKRPALIKVLIKKNMVARE